MKKRVAFVVQRCGVEVNGGAELLCRRVAERLAAHVETEVLTTCALDYTTWADHYRPGVEKLGELTIRRFRVPRPRDVEAFNQRSAALQPRLGRAPLEEEEAWMRAQGPCAPELFDWLRARKDEYDAFVFVTYLYATTYFGLPLVADKALLVPLAHDEWPMRLRLWDRFFELPRGFVFSSDEEAAFLRRRFPGARLEGPVVGMAVEPPVALDPAAFRRAFGIEGPFVLYVGRLDPSKGVDRLVHDFEAYRAQSGDSATQLVLVGKAVMDVPRRPWLHAVGFVSDEQKWNALAACEALAMPSPYESLSIALLEAWSVAKPVLVDARSEVLVGQCRRSQGGLWYASTDEFSAALDCLLHDDRVRSALGAQGRRFVFDQYRWPRIVATYRELLDRVS